jgi:hypothetical protein
MEASEDGRLDDAPVGVRRSPAVDGDLLHDPLMRAVGVEVPGILSKHALQVTVVDEDFVAHQKWTACAHEKWSRPGAGFGA